MTSEYFDTWHANNTRSPARDEIHRRHLGLPPYMTSDSLLPWEGIAEVTEALRLKPGDTLFDLACGRGAYGLEIARRTGARLVGVDFAESAAQAARALAASLGQDADFGVADMTGTGLARGSVDAVLSVDSTQFGLRPGPVSVHAWPVGWPTRFGRGFMVRHPREGGEQAPAAAGCPFPRTG